MNAYKYKKKRKKLSRRAKAKIFLCSFLAIITLMTVYYFKVVTPIVVTLSEEKVRSLSTKAVSASVGQVLMNDGISYGDLVKIQYNNSGEITLINTDSVEVNLLVRKVTEIVQVQMDNLGSHGVEISLGTLTGIPFLYGIGPNVSVKLVPVGTVNTRFNSSFTSAGINQTLHRLYFMVSINIGMVLPCLTKNMVTDLEIEICESVIIGKVPDVYFQGGLNNTI